MTQYVINIGTIPNDGTGDPLRTAFNEVNLNFDQVFAAGPVLSNVQIANNTILTTNTNGNLVLAPNGIGVVQANVNIVPNTSNIRNLGAANRRWSTLYIQYANISGAITVADLTATGNVTVGGNLSVTGNVINVGNIITDAKTIQLANTAGSANAADGSGITVGANDAIATMLYSSSSNSWVMNIGIDTPNLVVNNISSDDSTFVTIQEGLDVQGDITAETVSVTGNVTGNYILGNAAFMTGLPTPYANANVVAYGQAGWAGNIIPAGNANYSLGNATNQWKSLYVSNTTIYINNVPISLTAGNVLTVNGQDVVTTSNTGDANIGNLAIYGATIAIQPGASDTLINISPSGESWAYLQLPTNDTANSYNTRLWNAAGNVEIGSGDFSNSGPSYDWIFGKDGNLVTSSNLVVGPSPAGGSSILQPDSDLQVVGEGANAFVVAGWAANTNAPDSIAVVAFNSPYNNGTSNAVIAVGNNATTVNYWTFANNGTTTFPTLTVNLHNGGNQAGQVLQFGDDSQQAIITGPTPEEDNNAERLIIQGQRGNGTGEGGDVYLWGGDAEFNGGDIKIYAGDADNVASGSGGYVNIEGGSGFDSGGYASLRGGQTNNGQGAYAQVVGGYGVSGGDANITGGQGYAGSGGNVNITGGISGNGLAEYGNVNITAGSTTWTFLNTGTLVFPDSQSSIFGGLDNDFTIDTANTGNATYTFTFGQFGDLSVPVNLNVSGNIYADTIEGPGNSNVTITANAQSWLFETDGRLFLPNSGVINASGNSVDIGSEDAISLEANTVVNIYTDTNGAGHQWQFGDAGELTLPASSEIKEVANPGGFPGFALALVPDPNNAIDADQQLLIYPTGGVDANHLHLTSGNLYNTELFLGNDNLYVKLANTGNIIINSNDDVGNSAQWTFDTTGNLTAPGNITGNYFIGNGSQLTGLPASYGDANVATFLAAYGSNTVSTTGNITAGNFVGAGSNVDIVAGSYDWTFDNTGNLTLPGNTFTVNYANGTAVSLGGNYGDSNVSTFLAAFGSNSISTTGNVTANIVAATNNGNGTNFKVGDDMWLGDVSVADTMSLRGQQSAANAYILFGNADTTSTLGRSGSGPLTYNGAFAANTITLSGTGTAVNASSGNILTNRVTGTQFAFLNGIYTAVLTGAGATGNYTLNLPANVGSNGQSLTSDGTGNLIWTTPASSYGNANVATFLAAFGSNTISTTGNVTAANFIGNIEITGNISGTSANVEIVAGVYEWTFDNTGNLTLPGNTFAVNYANGTAVSLGGGSYGNANVADFLDSLGSNAIVTTGNITGGNLISSATLFANPDLILGNTANASATKTRIVTDTTFSYIQTGNGTVGSTGNIVFSPYASSTQRVVIDTASGNISATGNITAANLGNIANINLNGNSSQVLYGNGVFAAVAGGSYGDSNVATFLGTYGSNTISSTGNITTTATANVGTLAVTGNATVSGTGSNLIRRATGLVAADTNVTLDDLSANVTSSGSQLAISTSGSWQGTGWTESFVGAGVTVQNWVNLPMNPGYAFASQAMNSQGHGCRCVISDQTPTAKVYQITVVRSGTTGAQWNITIERLV